MPPFTVQIPGSTILLLQGTQGQAQAEARLRPLAILDATIQDDDRQPSTAIIKDKIGQIANGQAWASIFPGVAVIQLMTEGNGPTVSLRLTKKEGVPVYRTSDDGQGLPIVERRVSELGFYSLGLNDLAGHVNLSPPRTSVMVRYLQLEDDETFFKEIAIGRLKVKRYSQHAIKAIRDLIACENIDEIWQKHRPRPKLTKKDRR